MVDGGWGRRRITTHSLVAKRFGGRGHACFASSMQRDSHRSTVPHRHAHTPSVVLFITVAAPGVVSCCRATVDDRLQGRGL